MIYKKQINVPIVPNISTSIQNSLKIYLMKTTLGQFGKGSNQLQITNKKVQIIHRLTTLLRPTASTNSIAVLTSSTNQESVNRTTQTNHHPLLSKHTKSNHYSKNKIPGKPPAQTVYSQQHYVTVLLCWPRCSLTFLTNL